MGAEVGGLVGAAVGAVVGAAVGGRVGAAVGGGVVGAGVGRVVGAEVGEDARYIYRGVRTGDDEGRAGGPEKRKVQMGSYPRGFSCPSGSFLTAWDERNVIDPHCSSAGIHVGLDDKAGQLGTRAQSEAGHGNGDQTPLASRNRCRESDRVSDDRCASSVNLDGKGAGADRSQTSIDVELQRCV